MQQNRLLFHYRLRLLMKQAILARSDLGMTPGKLAAQVAHASLSAYLKSDSKTQKIWKRDGQTKIVLKAPDQNVLFEFKKIAEENNIPAVIIKDAGRTQLEPGTITTLGMGPAEDSLLDEIVCDLSLY